jgi:hypothetical protein
VAGLAVDQENDGAEELQDYLWENHSSPMAHERGMRAGKWEKFRMEIWCKSRLPLVLRGLEVCVCAQNQPKSFCLVSCRWSCEEEGQQKDEG